MAPGYNGTFSFYVKRRATLLSVPIWSLAVGSNMHFELQASTNPISIAMALQQAVFFKKLSIGGPFWEDEVVSALQSFWYGQATFLAIITIAKFGDGAGETMTLFDQAAKLTGQPVFYSPPMIPTGIANLRLPHPKVQHISNTPAGIASGILRSVMENS